MGPQGGKLAMNPRTTLGVRLGSGACVRSVWVSNELALAGLRPEVAQRGASSTFPTPESTPSIPAIIAKLAEVKFWFTGLQHDHSMGSGLLIVAKRVARPAVPGWDASSRLDDVGAELSGRLNPSDRILPPPAPRFSNWFFAIAVLTFAAFGLGWLAALMFVSPPWEKQASVGKGDLQNSIASTRKLPVRTTKLNDSSRFHLAAPTVPQNASPQIVREASSQQPALETKPSSIEGWSVSSVGPNGAVIRGPDGFWTVKPGDTLPGLGRIDTIVRWGSYWIVGTSAGLISG